MDNRPIGIFDSGVGGLTVAAQVLKQLPNEEIVYFGDTARLPYGSKSRETVTRFSKQNVRFLRSMDVKAVIVACNTASSNALEALQETFDLPIFGVVTPGVVEAVRLTERKRVGVIGTAGTVRSRAYETLICAKDPEIQVFSKACPLFVPIVEEGWAGTHIAALTAKEYLAELLQQQVDTIVLGCTHYPLLKKTIGDVVGQDVILVDPAKETALVVKRYLEAQDALRGEGTQPVHRFYVSDISDQFAMISDVALHQSFVPEKIDIEQY